jgi:hypothetical protein
MLAHEIFINIKEKPAQYELLRDGDLRQIRLVRYSAPCRFVVQPFILKTARLIIRVAWLNAAMKVPESMCSALIESLGEDDS